MRNDVHALAYDEHATRMIETVARKQYARRARAFNEGAIFSPEDLSQELWAKLTSEQARGKLLSVFVATDDDFWDYLVSLCDNMVRNLRRHVEDGYSVPMAMLNKHDMSNLWHGAGYELEATFDDIFERQSHWG